MSDQAPQQPDSQEPPLTDHAYDGIQEFDNPTPGWWTWLFVLTVIFSGVYFLFVTLAGGQLSPIGFYDRAVTADLQTQFAALGDLKPDAATILKLSKDEKWLKVGASIFTANCASCHGGEGQGLSGPNLTDDAYLHVKAVEDLADVVVKGRNNNAMPPWGNRLRTNEVVLVSSYVASLRGKNRPGRELQGSSIPAWSGE